jgi:hypothetical protein
MIRYKVYRIPKEVCNTLMICEGESQSLSEAEGIKRQCKALASDSLLDACEWIICPTGGTT